MSDWAFDPPAVVADHDYASALQQGLRFARNWLRVLGFWAAVSLPFLHVPLLLGGLDSTAELLAFGVLLGSNLVAFLVGHQYRSP